MATVTVSTRPLHSGTSGGKAGTVDPDAPPDSLYLPAWRPWLALYGARVRSAGHRRAQEVRLRAGLSCTPSMSACKLMVSRERSGIDVADAPQADAPIQALLPDELLLHILSLLPVRSLATACCVCQQWRQLGDSQVSIISPAPLQLLHFRS